jgi:hypothetical protein
MRIKVRLMNNFPHIRSVGLSFLEKPTIDYVLKPVGGETFGVDIAYVSTPQPYRIDGGHTDLHTLSPALPLHCE